MPLTPVDELPVQVRQVLPQLLHTLKKEDEVAAALGVAAGQARAWLELLLAEGVLEKGGHPVTYSLKHRPQP